MKSLLEELFLSWLAGTLTLAMLSLLFMLNLVCLKAIEAQGATGLSIILTFFEIIIPCTVGMVVRDMKEQSS